MAWTDPPTAQPGNVIASSTFFNVAIRDNLRSMRHLLYAKSAITDVNTTTSLTDLLGDSVTIPANAVGPSGAVWCELVGDYLANSGTPTLTIQITLGATTLWQATSGTFTADTDRHAISILFGIYACGATNLQYMSGYFALAPAAPGTVGLGTLGGGTISPFATSGQSAVDMTANQTLKVKAAHSVSSASVSVRCVAANVWVRP